MRNQSCPAGFFLVAVVWMTLQLTACSTAPSARRDTAAGNNTRPPFKGGGYYQDDGPGDNPPADLLTRPDAVPRIEPLASGANKPYTVLGNYYVPLSATTPVKQRGIASWYGRKFQGQRTSTGERYDMYEMTAAHTLMPLPSYARVSNPANGRSVIVRVNDRGPFLRDRIMDLSYAAAYKLGIVNAGSGEVVVERLMPDEIARLQQLRGEKPPILLADNTSATNVSAAASNAASTPSAPVAVPFAVTAADAPSGNSLPPPGSTAITAADPSSNSAIAPNDNPAETAPLASDASSAGAPSTVYLQLGAFGTRSNAERLLARIQETGELIAGELRIINSNALFKLQAGPLDSARALQLSERFQQRFALTPILIAR